MRISQICIRRPVFATVLSLLLIVAGLLAYQELAWRFYPATFKPKVSIQTTYVGASPTQIEASITDPLENALANIPDIDSISSDSSQGSSNIQVQFSSVSQQTFIIDQSQMLQAIASVNLPAGANQPILRMSGKGQNMLAVVAVSDTELKPEQVVDYVTNVLQKQLQQLPGIGQVQVGAGQPTLRIALDPLKLAQWNLTAQQVVQVLQDNNISLPAGQLINNQQIIPLNTTLTLANIAEFKALTVANRKGHLVRLSDVANVFIGYQSLTGTFSTVDGKPGVVVWVSYSDDANPLALGQALRDRVIQMQAVAPPGMQIKELIDFSLILQQSVDEVVYTILEAIALVVLVTFLFLGNWRVTLIPIVTIPVCLIGSFVFMFLMGFSIDIMTLLAFVLAVGLVVDDAIVVLENNHRHLEAGKSPKEAASIGIQEISFAIIAMTICLVAVYMPAGFMTGKMAVYFQEFSFTLAAAVLVSGFVALTLSPMMCSKVLTSTAATSRYQNFIEQFFNRLRLRYARLLRRVLNAKKWVVVLFVILLGIGVWVFRSLPTELMPATDPGVVISYVDTPDTASTALTFAQDQAWMRQVQKLPEVASYVSMAGGNFDDQLNEAFNIIQLKPFAQRTLTTPEVAEQISQLGRNMPGIDNGAMAMDLNSTENMFNRGSIKFYVVGLLPRDQLVIAANRLGDALKNLKSIHNVSVDSDVGSQQYNIGIVRDRAAQLGVATTDITQSIQILLGGDQLSQGYQMNGITYPLVVQMNARFLQDLSALDMIFVPSGSGKLVPLAQLVTVTPISGAADRQHFGGLPAIDISVTVNAAEGYTTGQVVDQINQLARQMLGGSTQIAYGPNVTRMLQNDSSMAMVFSFGLIFIYLILAALFESFLDPLIVLLTVPLCVVGALLLLKITGGTVNLFTGLGLVTLIGLISKHGVLIARFANERLAQGATKLDAVVEAASIRLRPILMTTATMVLGAVPLLFAVGADAVSRQQIGVVIVAGLLIGTVFSLFVVPVAYILLKKGEKI